MEDTTTLAAASQLFINTILLFYSLGSNGRYGTVTDGGLWLFGTFPEAQE